MLQAWWHIRELIESIEPLTTRVCSKKKQLDARVSSVECTCVDILHRVAGTFDGSCPTNCRMHERKAEITYIKGVAQDPYRIFTLQNGSVVYVAWRYSSSRMGSVWSDSSHPFPFFFACTSRGVAQTPYGSRVNRLSERWNMQRQLKFDKRNASVAWKEEGERMRLTFSNTCVITSL